MEPIELRIAAMIDKADADQTRAREVIQELQATGVALGDGVSQAATKAVKEAFQELEGDINRARKAMRWFSARWIVIVGVSLACLFALAGGLTWAMLAWQRHEVNGLIEKRAALEADIAEMQVNAAALAKKGARIKIVDCGGRLCIVANKRQSDEATDWHGIWNNEKTGQTFVIPQGY